MLTVGDGIVGEGVVTDGEGTDEALSTSSFSEVSSFTGTVPTTVAFTILSPSEDGISVSNLTLSFSPKLSVLPVVGSATNSTDVGTAVVANRWVGGNVVE